MHVYNYTSPGALLSRGYNQGRGTYQHNGNDEMAATDGKHVDLAVPNAHLAVTSSQPTLQERGGQRTARHG